MLKENKLNQHYHYGLLMLEKMMLAFMDQYCVKNLKILQKKKMGIENVIASERWFYCWEKRENIVYK